MTTSELPLPKGRGFKKWLHDQQSSFINYDELDMSNYQRAGGVYADKPDRELIENFFDGNNKGVTSDLPSSGGQARIDVFQEELNSLVKEWNSKLNHSKVYADIELADQFLDVEDMYIYSGAIITFNFQGQLKNEISYESQNLIIMNLSKFLELPKINMNIYDLDFKYNESTNIITISIKIDFEDVSDPDTFDSMCSELETIEDNYNEIAYHLRDLLINSNIIDSYNIREREDYIKHFENMKFRFYEDGPDYLTSYWNVPFKLESSFWKNNTELSSPKNPIKKELENLFKINLPFYMENQIKNISTEQIEFDFVDNTPWDNWKNNPLFKGKIPVPNINIEIDYYQIGTPYYSTNENKINLILSIPESEVYKFGIQYFYILRDALPFVMKDLMNKIHEIDKIKSNEGFSEETNQTFPSMTSKEEVQTTEDIQKNHESKEKDKKENNFTTTGLSWYSKFKVGKELKLI